jgi:prolipoprotein diacylglyceryltransferase
MQISFPIVGISWFGFFVVLGIGFGMMVVVSLSASVGMTRLHAFFFALKILLWGLIGSVCLFWIENATYFIQSPYNILYIWDAGLSLWGAILVGASTVFIYLRHDHNKAWQAMTVGSWALLAGLGISRVGDLMVGTTTHPVAMYEILLLLMILGALLGSRKLDLPAWGKFAITLGGYAFTRLFVSFFQDVPVWMGLHSAQWISLLVLTSIGGTVVWRQVRLRANRNKIVN